MIAKLNDGFELELDEEALDDMELLEDFAAMDKGDAYAMPAAVKRLLGKENKKKLYDHLRNSAGRVSATAVGNAVFELMQSVQAGKNSSASPT